jgi:hypothetical protein
MVSNYTTNTIELTEIVKYSLHQLTISSKNLASSRLRVSPAVCPSSRSSRLLPYYTVNGNNLRFLTLTATLSHRERELKEVAINGRSKYNPVPQTNHQPYPSLSDLPGPQSNSTIRAKSRSVPGVTL